MPSLLDIIPPEAQHLLGILSLISVAAGFILWLAGVKIARFSVAILLGLVGATQLSRDLPVNPVTAALIGFVMGALLGAIAFKFLQAFVLAACVALAAAAITCHYQPIPAQPPAKNASIPISTLTIPTNHFSAQSPQSATPQSALAALAPKLLARWNALPPAFQHRLLLITLSSALAALLLALLFQRFATWIISASLGSLLILAGLYTAAQIYTPQYTHLIPASPLNIYLALALLTSLGLFLQRKYFWPRSTRPNPLPQLENPLYRGPVPYPQP